MFLPNHHGWSSIRLEPKWWFVLSYLKTSGWWNVTICDQTYCRWKRCDQPVHVENLPFVIGFVYIGWWHRVSSVSSIDSMMVFLTCQKTQVRKKGLFREISWVWSGKDSCRYTGEHRFATDPTGCLYLGNWICNGKWWCYGTEVNLGKCCNLVSRVDQVETS